MAMPTYSDPLLQLLVDRGLVRSIQAEEIRQEHETSRKPVRRIVLDKELVTEDRLLAVMAEYMGSRVINLPATDIPPAVVRSVPFAIARMYNVVPVSATASAVEMAVFDIVPTQTMDEIMFVLTRDVSFVFAREEDVHNFVNQFYGDESDAVANMLKAAESEMESVGEAITVGSADDEQGIAEAAGAAPVIRFVNLVLFQAVNARASDVHFEPFEKEFKIRYRVDGALYEMAPPGKRLALPVISRIKVMSGLDIAERRLPQDGKISLTVGGRVIDLRVSTLPTQFGESVVLRVLDRSVVSLEIENLGMPEDVYQGFVHDITIPNGIVIVTGPTGSGKTTTLYSGLRRINTIETKILTAEEPVEYDIDGIVQVPISEQTGNTFSIVLRAFLRQDPDVLMIGEIRDLDTAQIAIHAALTGHLVFSTLHTNDAAGAVTRLIDMDVEPYLISSTLEMVLGQRLVRTICDKCKTAYRPDRDVLQRMEVKEQEIGGRPFYYGAGCQSCNESGYRGRRGVYEYLKITEAIRVLINDRKPSLMIREKAIEQGMRTLRQDGLRNILDGYTTVEEVMRYT